MNKKILIPIIAFFALIPSAFALFPQPVSDVFQSIFGGIPSEVSSRGLFALVMFCIFLISLGYIFKEARLKNIRIFLALILGVISGIGIPYNLLETMFTSYGCMGGIVVVAFPIFGMFYIVFRFIKPDKDHGKMAYGFRVIIFILGATFIGSTVHTLGYDCGAWGFSLAEAADLIAIGLWIFAIINFLKLFGNGGAVEFGKGDDTKKPEETKPETPKKPEETKKEEESGKEGGESDKDEDEKPEDSEGLKWIKKIRSAVTGIINAIKRILANKSDGSLAAFLIAKGNYGGIYLMDKVKDVFPGIIEDYNTKIRPFIEKKVQANKMPMDILRGLDKALRNANTYYNWLIQTDRIKKVQDEIRFVLMKLAAGDSEAKTFSLVFENFDKAIEKKVDYDEKSSSDPKFVDLRNLSPSSGSSTANAVQYKRKRNKIIKDLKKEMTPYVDFLKGQVPNVRKALAEIMTKLNDYRDIIIKIQDKWFNK